MCLAADCIRTFLLVPMCLCKTIWTISSQEANISAIVVRKAYYSMSVLFKNVSCLTISLLFPRHSCHLFILFWSTRVLFGHQLCTTIVRLHASRLLISWNLCSVSSLVNCFVDMCYTDRLKFLKMEPLERRRLKLGLTMVYVR